MITKRKRVSCKYRQIPTVYILSQAKSAVAKLDADKVSFQWEDISANSLGGATDKAILLVYNVNNFELSYSIGQETRQSSSALLPIPNGKAVGYVGSILVLSIGHRPNIGFNKSV